MALELSKQAFELCWEGDAPGLQAFLEAHAGVDLYLYLKEGCYDIAGVAAHHESPECL
jgi:ankyrin repeat protein